MRRFPVWLAVSGLVVFAGAPASLSAQGYSVNEHGTCAMGRAGTAVAAPCADGSAIFFNPAGIANAQKGVWTISTGVTAIAPSGGFTDDATGLRTDLEKIVIPVPALYLQGGLTDKLSVGIGAFAPYGLTTEWPENSEVRFLGYKSTIRAIYVQPTVAYRVTDQFKVGAGFDVNLLHLALNQRVDLFEQQAAPGVTFGNLGFQRGTDIADVELTGNGTGVGYHVGAICRAQQPGESGHPLPVAAEREGRQRRGQDRPGVHRHHPAAGQSARRPRRDPARHHPLAPVQRRRAVAGPGRKHRAPDAGSAVRRHHGEADREADAAVRRHLHQLEGVRYGRDHHRPAAPGQPDRELEGHHRPALRRRLRDQPRHRHPGGYLVHSAALPAGSVTPNLPEGKRAEFTVGFGTRLGSKLRADLAYQYINQQNRRGRSVDFGEPDNGLFEFKAHLFGATLSYTF